MCVCVCVCVCVSHKSKRQVRVLRDGVHNGWEPIRNENSANIMAAE